MGNIKYTFMFLIISICIVVPSAYKIEGCKADAISNTDMISIDDDHVLINAEDYNNLKIELDHYDTIFAYIFFACLGVLLIILVIEERNIIKKKE